MLIGDWNEECIGRSNSKKLCDEFGLMNIFHGKFPNHEKSKKYQEGSAFIDYGLIHKDLIDKVDQVTYKPFGYRKGKGDHQGWHLDIRETDLFGNQIDGVYQSKGRSLQSKDCKQLPDYLRAVEKYLIKHNVYNRIKKLMKSKRKNTKKQNRLMKQSHKQPNTVNNNVKYGTRIIGTLMFIP